MQFTPGLLLTSPEDIILNKLEWYKLGNEASERQWKDIIGVLRIQENGLDYGYLKKWATELDLSLLLEKALLEKSD